MSKVKGSSLHVGNMLSGQYDLTDKKVRFHHPFLVIAVEPTHVLMRNCTSHESASFKTVIINREDKVGSFDMGPSYVVLNGTLETGVFGVPVLMQDGTEQVTVPGSPKFGAYVDEDGDKCFGPYTPNTVETRPRWVEKFLDIYYERTCTVKLERMVQVLEALKT